MEPHAKNTNVTLISGRSLGLGHDNYGEDDYWRTEEPIHLSRTNLRISKFILLGKNLFFDEVILPRVGGVLEGSDLVLADLPPNGSVLKPSGCNNILATITLITITTDDHQS